MLGGADQVQIFAFDLIHHRVHLREGHDAGDHVGTDHEGRHAVGEAAVDHEVPGVGDDGGMQAGDVSHQIIEAVSGHPAGAVQIDAVEGFHDVRMIGHLEIRDHGLAEALQLHVFGIIFADRDRRIDDVRDDHHLL